MAGRRPDGPERRSFPRPPLWLNLLLLVIAGATFAYARHHHQEVVRETALLFKPTATNPGEMNRIREELSDMDVSREQLAKELDARLQYLQSLNGEQFYISIDTSKKKMEFRLGKYVIFLPDNYVIHSPPSDSPLKGPKPGSFMVPEADLAAIWPRITKDTRVYIF